MKKEEFGKSWPPSFLLGEMRDSGAVFVTCPEGHRSAVIYSSRKHEIFFASGAMAYLDGYVTEAISSFSSALERFYEFCIRVICRKQELSHDAFESSWKAVARQSERQFGAFCFLYALETNLSFSLPTSIPELRNKVIHHGYIPSNQELYDFAERIFRILRAAVVQLRKSAEDSIKKEDDDQFKRQLDDIPKDMDKGSGLFLNCQHQNGERSKQVFHAAFFHSI